MRVFSELLSEGWVSVYDVDQNSLTNIKTSHPKVRVFPDFNNFISQKHLDAVVVSSPASTHFMIGTEALQRGKHVLIEKPLALDLQQGSDLVKQAESEGLVLMVGHTYLYNPGITKLKQYVNDKDGGVGRIYYLYAVRTNFGPIRNDVNVLWDLAPHDIAIFSYLLNLQPLAVNAVADRPLGNSKEDVCFLSLTYPGHIIANIHVSWIDPNRVRQVVVVGSQRRILFDDLNVQETVRIFEKSMSSTYRARDSFGDFVVSVRDGDIISPYIERSEPLKNQCKHFLECIQNGSRPLTDAHHGLEVVRVLAAAQRSLESEGAMIGC